MPQRRIVDACFASACIISDARNSPSQRLCYYISSQRRQAKVVRYLRAVRNSITAAGLKRVYNGDVSRTTQAWRDHPDLWAMASPHTAAARSVCLSVIITGVCFRLPVTLSDLAVQSSTGAPSLWFLVSDISAQMHRCCGTIRAPYEHDAHKALVSLSLVRRQELCGSEF